MRLIVLSKMNIFIQRRQVLFKVASMKIYVTREYIPNFQLLIANKQQTTNIIKK